MRKRKMVDRKCLNCDDDFEARADKVKKGNGKFCCLSCAISYNNRKKTGKMNPNWKGGISANNYHYKLIQIERYPDRVHSRALAYEAYRSGKLIKDVCEKCRSGNTEMHHDDYSKPFDVRWLCKDHHREEHPRPG